jgi:hypothetical protein
LKHRLTGILLLFCFVAPLATHYLALRYQQKLVRREIKRRMMAGIDKAALVKLQLSEGGQQRLRWVHAREFEYEGEMYDIVYSEQAGDTTTYWLWWDHEETRLNRQLDRWAAVALAHSPGQQEKQAQLSLFLKTLICPPPPATAALAPLPAAAALPPAREARSRMAGPPPAPPPEVSSTHV